jgi:predicted dehydrogenase
VGSGASFFMRFVGIDLGHMSGQILRGAIIGFGFISGKGHAPAYAARARSSRDVDIVAVADLCEARRAAAREQFPNARIYSDAESLLAAEEGKVDFVDISTPPCDHARIAHLAFERGMHVLCEKPLTTSLADARAMLDHAVQAKRVLFPCHNYKHAPVVKTIREIIASGKIGQVRSVTLNTYRNTHAKGVTEWKTHWRRENRYSGGGIAMDHGSHSFYLTFDWLGTYPTAVTAKMSNLEPERWDTEDNFTAVLTFPNGLAHAHLSWTAGVRKVIYTVQGTLGAITVDDDDLQVAIMRKTSGPDVAQGAVTWDVQKSQIASDWMDASHVGWFNSMFDQFRQAITDSDWAGKEAQEAYRCVEIITQAYASAQAKSLEMKLDSLD